MVALSTLKYLAIKKVKDAEILLKNGRNSAAIYLMGYALEFSFKRKICQTLGFAHGFPENEHELADYSTQIIDMKNTDTSAKISHIKQIRNHKLPELILFSGVEDIITTAYRQQWQLVKNWNPENRYIRQRISHQKAFSFVMASKQILKEIL